MMDEWLESDIQLVTLTEYNLSTSGNCTYVLLPLEEYQVDDGKAQR